jgi:hypothetical protein
VKNPHDRDRVFALAREALDALRSALDRQQPPAAAG